jgi:hypothetical protein
VQDSWGFCAAGLAVPWIAPFFAAAWFDQNVG